MTNATKMNFQEIKTRIPQNTVTVLLSVLQLYRSCRLIVPSSFESILNINCKRGFLITTLAANSVDIVCRPYDASCKRVNYFPYHLRFRLQGNTSENIYPKYHHQASQPYCSILCKAGWSGWTDFSTIITTARFDRSV